MIELFFGYILLLFVSIFLIRFVKISTGSFYSASTFLIFPYLVVVSIQVIFIVALKLQIPTLEYFIVLTLFFFVSAATDIFARTFAKRIKFSNNHTKYNDGKIKVVDNFLKISSIIVIMYCLYYFIHLARQYPNFYYVVQEEFQNEYASSIYFLRLFLMLTTTYFLGCSKLTRNNIIFGLFCSIPNFLTFVKSIILIPIVGGITLRIVKNELKISLKLIIIVLISAITVFFGVYLFEMSVYDISVLTNKNTYIFISIKFIFYLISGVQSMAQNIADYIKYFNTVDCIPLAPFYSLLSKFGLAERINIVSDHWVVVLESSTLGRTFSSNVYSYIGDLYLYCGLLLGNVINIFWTFIISFSIESFNNRNDIMTSMSYLLVAGFILAWFDSYFNQTFYFYLFFVSIIINLLTNFVLRIRKKI